MFYVASGSIPRRHPKRVRSALLALIALVLAACSPAPPGTAPTESTPRPDASPAQAPTESPSTSPPALVGTWLGVHNCQRIIDVMTSAGMPEQGLLNIVDVGALPGVTTVSEIADPENPCVRAVDVPHSHFFTASGLFGSRDEIGQQVDDGGWKILDADTFEISGTPFDFHIDGDELRMQPVDVGACPASGEWCQEAWKLMVAMPGMAWTRGAD